MKILIDCRFWGVEHTGLGRYTQNLVENLLRVDKDNQYVLLFNKPLGEFSIFPAERDPRLFRRDNFQFQTANIPHYSLKEQILLPQIIHKLKPDLVHFPHFNVPYFCQVPYIITIHDLIKHYSKGLETTTRMPLFYLLKYFGYKLVFAKSISRAKKIIVPSHFVKKDLEKNYPQIESKKVSVIYEGIGKEFRMMNDELRIKEKILNKYKIKKPYLLYVGNAYPHKNLKRLILAIKEIPTNLVIVGARDVFWQRLKKLVADLKAENLITLTGFVPDKDLTVLFSQAQAFINPSEMEGFGLPGLEAMALGCPVTCSDIPVFKEIYGNAAIYFNPENVEQMKEAILQVINISPEEKKALIRKGLAQVNKYSWQKTAQETLKIYESCFSL